jgi:hypothetical protein
LTLRQRLPLLRDRVDPQPTLVELLVRHVLLPRALLPQIEINSNIVRVIDWLKGRSCGEQKRKEGHFARLTPNLGSNQTSAYAGVH